MISAGELASMQHDVLPAMPDTASIQRQTGAVDTWQTVATVACRLGPATGPVNGIPMPPNLAPLQPWLMTTAVTNVVLPNDRIAANGRTWQVVGSFAGKTWEISRVWLLVLRS